MHEHRYLCCLLTQWPNLCTKLFTMEQCCEICNCVLTLPTESAEPYVPLVRLFMELRQVPKVRAPAYCGASHDGRRHDSRTRISRRWDRRFKQQAWMALTVVLVVGAWSCQQETRRRDTLQRSTPVCSFGRGCMRKMPKLKSCVCST